MYTVAQRGPGSRSTNGIFSRTLTSDIPVACATRRLRPSTRGPRCGGIVIRIGETHETGLTSSTEAFNAMLVKF